MAVTVPESTLTLQKILSRYGYRNGLIGKLHYLAHSNRDHRDPHPAYDFHHMELSDEPGCYEDAYRAWVRRKAPEALDHISLGLPPAGEFWRKGSGYADDIKHPERFNSGGVVRRTYVHKAPSHLTQAAFVGEQTMEFLAQNKDTPFFCFSGFYSPHSPWVVPQEFLDLYDPQKLPIPAFPPEIEAQRSDGRCSDRELRDIVHGYYAMVSEVDAWVGRILDTLDELGLADSTIVVFSSDHGEWLGEHLRYGKGYWAQDAISRVPLIVKVPQALGGAAGVHFPDIVEGVDVVPTLLDAAGIQIPPEVQGDLLPVLALRPICAGDGLGLTEHAGWKSLRFEHYRYVAEASGTERLYDLDSDPSEYANLADLPEHAGLLSRARKLLLTRVLRIEQPLRKEWAY
jgi:arylsulfatase A-like enzyme